jgi:hypothetical protein
MTVRQVQSLESSYVIVFVDALRVKIPDEGLIGNNVVYPAIGMRPRWPPAGPSTVGWAERRRQVLVADHERAA